MNNKEVNTIWPLQRILDGEEKKSEDSFIMIDDDCFGYFNFSLIFHRLNKYFFEGPSAPPWLRFMAGWPRKISWRVHHQQWILKCCREEGTTELRRKNQHKSLSKCLAFPIKKTMPCNFQSLTQFNFAEAKSGGGGFLFVFPCPPTNCPADALWHHPLLQLSRSKHTGSALWVARRVFR